MRFHGTPKQPIVAILALSLLFACGEPPAPKASDEDAPPPNPATEALASYVLLAGVPADEPSSQPVNGTATAYARVIIDDSFDCPSVAASCGSETPTPKPMKARQKPIFDTAHGCPTGGCFPVKVCEAPVPFEQASQVCLGGGSPPIELPKPTMSPGEVLVMGDTGCKDSNDDGGDCSYSQTSKAEPFGQLVSAVADDGKSFQLVVHMGDYNYRGTPGSVPTSGDSFKPYDAGDNVKHGCGQDPTDAYLSQASSDSKLPDQWSIWSKDFFEPAKDLLEAAPWVFARGNHELCSRAGAGWFYFLDAGITADGTQIDCPELATGAMEDPYTYSTIAPMYIVGLESLNLIVLDSANACDAGVPAKVDGQDNSFVTAYHGQFASLAVPGTGTNWIMSHRPFWENATLQATSKGGKTLEGIQLSLAGHRHLFESYAPTTSNLPWYPPEVVAGNGGVKPDTSLGDACAEVEAAETKAWQAGVEGYGFLQVSLASLPGWNGDLTGWSWGKYTDTPPPLTVTAKCDSSNADYLCPAAGTKCG